MSDAQIDRDEWAIPPTVAYVTELRERAEAAEAALHDLLVETRTWIKPDEAEANEVWDRGFALLGSLDLGGTA